MVPPQHSSKAAIKCARQLLGYLPQNNLESPPQMATEEPLDREEETLDRLVPA